MQTPVALIIFNRPYLTRGLVDSLREVRPQKVFVIADGPRNERDRALVEQSRAEINKIDWNCDLTKLYSDINLGCRDRVVSGLDAVFEATDKCIVLEDDIRADPTFFPFAMEMLERYKDDQRIFSIGSGNFSHETVRSTFSYHFSIYISTWGWATWRRSWKMYDREIPLWPQLKDIRWLSYLLQDPGEEAFFSSAFDGVFSKRIDTWDYQLLLASWANHTLNIMPNETLCRNVGFDHPDATHPASGSAFSSIKAKQIAFPLRHPTVVFPSPGARQIYKAAHPSSIKIFI